MCQQAAQTAPVVNSASPAPHACGCGGHGATPARPEVGRRVPESHDMDFPEVPFPTARVLEIAGEAALRAVVFRHHGLLKQSEIGHLFVQDETAFAKLVGLIADFVVETCGGPQRFTEARGGGCMRTRHFPFTIDERGRDVWLEKLYQAIGDTSFPVELREEYWTWLEAMTIRMINRRTTKAQPERISWAQAATRFGQPVAA